MEHIRHIRNTHPDKESLDRRTESLEQPAARNQVEKMSPETKRRHDRKEGAIEVNFEQKQVSEFLNSINEKILQDIFAEYFRYAGNVEKNMNWTALKDVRILYKNTVHDDHFFAEYNSRVGITLRAHKLESNEQILWALIHEQCHSVTASGWLGESYQEDVETGEISGKDIEMIGLEKTTMISSSGEDPELKIQNTNINEGVTQFLTERIFREYILRSGHDVFESTSNNHPDEDEKTWKQIQIEEAVATQKIGEYDRYWNNARLYIGIISALTDVPTDVVEKGVFRSYFRNGSLNFEEDSEIIELLDSINPKLKNVLQDMLNATDEDFSFEKVPHWIQNRNDIPNDIRQRVVDEANSIIDDYRESFDTFMNS